MQLRKLEQHTPNTAYGQTFQCFYSSNLSLGIRVRHRLFPRISCLGGVRKSMGVQTKSGSAEPALRAPAHGEAVLGVDAGGGRPLPSRGSGVEPPENF
jgi:hypothetical protein